MQINSKGKDVSLCVTLASDRGTIGSSHPDKVAHELLLHRRFRFFLALWDSTYFHWGR